MPARSVSRLRPIAELAKLVHKDKVPEGQSSLATAIRGSGAGAAGRTNSTARHSLASLTNGAGGPSLEVGKGPPKVSSAGLTAGASGLAAIRGPVISEGRGRGSRGACSLGGVAKDEVTEGAIYATAG